MPPKPKAETQLAPTLSQEKAQQLAKLSNESSSQTERVYTPTLETHQPGTVEEGQFYIKHIESFGETAKTVGKEATVTFLRKREYLERWENKTKLWTPAYDSPDEIVPLMSLDTSKPGSKKLTVKEGTRKELRALYETKNADGSTGSSLKVVFLWYALYEGMVIRIDLKGSKLMSYLLYHESLEKKRIPISSIKTKITLSDLKVNGTVKWYPWQFAMAGPVTDLDPIFKHIEEINTGIKVMKESWEQRRLEKETADEKKELIDEKLKADI